MLLLVAYLFTALPQLLPRAALDFTCKLGDQQVRLVADSSWLTRHGCNLLEQNHSKVWC
jgi:hypothetical protein